MMIFFLVLLVNDSQNTANRHVSSTFDLLAAFISFPLASAEAGEANLPFPIRPQISCARAFAPFLEKQPF
jgi:hypothetical protein